MTIIEERNMAGKPITSTYKGILRISNNIDITEGTKDAFLNDEYYLAKGSDKWSGDGLQQTHSFLSENSSTRRFKSADEYLNLKIPVTDSAGNYLNFSLGSDSSLIGSDYKCGIIRTCINQFDNDDTVTLAVLTSSDTTVLGRSKQPIDKTLGADLKIESSDESTAKLVVLNKKRHSENVIAPIDSAEVVRTIYDVAKNSPKKYDVLIHEQENYEKNGKYKDCKVELQNLKQYVYDQVGRYLQADATSVPTGTIISQYCNLDKWYCWDTKYEFNDIDKWQGYRPAIVNSPNAPYSYYNVVQGKFLKTKSYLYYNDDRGSLNAFTSEMPPDFKRGYALCDGGALSIHLSPYWDQAAVNEKKSLEILLDLFHNIGYHYHKDGENPPIHNCVVLKDTIYTYTDNSNYWTNIYPANRDVCYGISMSSILAFKELDNIFSSKVNPFSGDTDEQKLENCLNWLGKQSIPEEYIFNVIVPSELETKDYKNSYYRYSDSKGNVKNYINIGRQISSFNDKIPYYKYTGGSNYTLTKCRIIDTAEVRDIAMLFINKLSNQNNWSRYYYTFYLPKLYTETDPDINDAYKYLANDGKDKSVKIGQFIGSNGTLIADSIEVPHLNKTFIPNERPVTYNCLYRHSYGYNAHNHAIAMGKTDFQGKEVSGHCYFEPVNDDNDPNNDEIDSEGSRISTLTSPEKNTYNKLKSNSISHTKVVAADYHHSFNPTINKTLLSTYLMDNYIFQDIPDDTDEKIIYSLGTGSVGYETLHSKSDTFKWYGRSSEPLWAEHDVTAKTLKYNECVGYFTPESIKVMPLIKL